MMSLTKGCFHTSVVIILLDINLHLEHTLPKATRQLDTLLKGILPKDTLQLDILLRATPQLVTPNMVVILVHQVTQGTDLVE